MFDDFMNFDNEEGNNSFGEDPKRKWMIEQPEEMAKAVRGLVAAEAGFSNREAEEFLSIEQIIKYFKEFGEATEDNEIHITSANLEDVCDALQAHIIGFDLTKCAASGMLDMFWSDEQDTMMFFKSDSNNVDIPRLTGPPDAQAVDVGDDEDIISEWEETISNISDDDDDESDFESDFEFDVDEDFFEGDYGDEEEEDDEEF